MHMRVCVYGYIHMCMCVWIYAYVCMCVYRSMHMRVCVCIDLWHIEKLLHIPWSWLITEGKAEVIYKSQTIKFLGHNKNKLEI